MQEHSDTENFFFIFCHFIIEEEYFGQIKKRLQIELIYVCNMHDALHYQLDTTKSLK